jgi:hypothetical protein
MKVTSVAPRFIVPSLTSKCQYQNPEGCGGPLVERQVGCDDGGTALITLTDQLEQQLAPV